MTVPTELVGAWERRSIGLGGAPPSEPASVVWVQGHSAYADLRVPSDPSEPVECFAGHTTWDPPNLHWSHELDLAGGPAALADVGAVEWIDGDLVERGSFTVDGVEVPYVEVWRRSPGSDGPVIEEVAPGSTRVVVGDHELAVVDRRADGGGFTAEYRRRGLLVLSHGCPAEVEA
jgi:hypothetical protein